MTVGLYWEDWTVGQSFLIKRRPPDPSNQATSRCAGR